MKIMITFNDEELRTFDNLRRNITMSNEEMIIKDEHIVGNFGEIKFDSSKKEFSVDLKSAFINAYTNIILVVVNMLKSLMSTCEIFASAWFEDTRDLIKEKVEAEKAAEENKEIENDNSTGNAIVTE